MVASLVSAPWASVTLVVAGIGYLCLVGEPEKGIQRHYWWPYVGWAIFASIFISMIAIVGYGATELYIRREISKGIIGVPRNTPDSSMRRQTAAYSATRVLQPDQIRILTTEFMPAAARTARRGGAAKPAGRISALPREPCSRSTRCRYGRT
jgi:hypothetical protein